MFAAGQSGRMVLYAVGAKHPLRDKRKFQMEAALAEDQARTGRLQRETTNARESSQKGIEQKLSPARRPTPSMTPSMSEGGCVAGAGAGPSPTLPLARAICSRTCISDRRDETEGRRHAEPFGGGDRI